MSSLRSLPTDYLMEVCEYGSNHQEKFDSHFLYILTQELENRKADKRKLTNES